MPYKVGSPEEESLDGLLDVLAMMRAAKTIHHTAHWVVTGPSSYGDHLLFERLYDSLGEDIDVLAEKIVATYGPQSIFPVDMNKRVLEHLLLLKSKPDSSGYTLALSSLSAEQHLQGLLESLYDFLKEAGTLSLGMDDFIMATASKREEAIYLLKQRIRP